MCSGRVNEGICLIIIRNFYTDLTGFKAGQVLKEYSAATVIEMITSIQAYNDSVKTAKWLVHPLAPLHSLEVSVEHADEVCGTCRTPKRTFDENDVDA